MAYFLHILALFLNLFFSVLIVLDIIVEYMLVITRNYNFLDIYTLKNFSKLLIFLYCSILGEITSVNKYVSIWEGFYIFDS